MRFRVFLLAIAAAMGVSHGSASSAHGSSEQVRYLRGHTEWVDSIAFSSDGSRVVSIDKENTVILWDTRTGKPLWKRRFVGDIRVCGDGRVLARRVTDRAVQLSDIGTGRVVRTLTDERGLSNFWFAPSCGLLVVLTRNNVLLSVDVQSGVRRPLMKLSTKDVLSISKNGKFLVNQENNVLRVWDITRGAPVSKIQLSYAGNVQAAFSSDGRLLAAYSGGPIYGESVLWDVRTRQVIHVLSQEWGVEKFAFSPDGRLLAMVGSRFAAPPNEKSQVLVWDVASGDVRASLEITLFRSGLDYSPDGRILAIADNRTVVLWTPEAGR